MSTDQDDYSNYYGKDGQPVRPGVVLNAEDQAIYDQYFAPITNNTTTEESHQ
jgi:hypothetical protein